MTADIVFRKTLSKFVHPLSKFVRFHGKFNGYSSETGVILGNRGASFELIEEVEMQKKTWLAISVAASLGAGLMLPTAGAFADGEIVFVGDSDNFPPITNRFPDLIPPEGPPLVSSDPTPTASPTVTPTPTETPNVTPSPTPSVEPVYTIQERPVSQPTRPVEVPSVKEPVVKTPTDETDSKPVVVTPPTVRPITTSAKPIQVPLKAGSTVITQAAQNTLAKTADSVTATNKPATIAVSTVGVTLTQATKQANTLVVQLKKLGVTATTKITRVAGKPVVTVVVTKKKG